MKNQELNTSEKVLEHAFPERDIVPGNPVTEATAALVASMTDRRNEAQRNLRHLEGQLKGVERAVENARAALEMANEMLDLANSLGGRK